MKTSLTTVILLVALFFTSCEEFPDQSDLTIDLGEIPLTDSTIAKIPYKDTSEQIIFIDSLSNEYTANVFPVNDFFTEVFRGFPYKNSNQRFLLLHQYQSIRSSFAIPDLERDFSLLTYARVDFGPNSYEDMIITDFTSLIVTGKDLGYPAGLVPEISITADRRSLDEDLIGTIASMPLLMINGREFKNVYTNEGTAATNIIVYFNFEFGVVAFKDGTSGITYYLKQ